MQGRAATYNLVKKKLLEEVKVEKRSTKLSGEVLITRYKVPVSGKVLFSYINIAFRWCSSQ